MGHRKLLRFTPGKLYLLSPEGRCISVSDAYHYFACAKVAMVSCGAQRANNAGKLGPCLMLLSASS